MSLVRITSSISLSDILEAKVEPIDVYESQVKEWFLTPSGYLAEKGADDPFSGMALLALLLTFFEPHGSTLTGEIGRGKSRSNFVAGFDAFRGFLGANGKLDTTTQQLDSATFYRWARCGLFHTSTLGGDLLVDTVGCSGSSLSRNPVFEGWLVDPWIMQRDLVEYFSSYVSLVRGSDRESELASNLAAVFAARVSEPLGELAIKEG